MLMRSTKAGQLKDEPLRMQARKSAAIKKSDVDPYALRNGLAGKHRPRQDDIAASKKRESLLSVSDSL